MCGIAGEFRFDGRFAATRRRASGSPRGSGPARTGRLRALGRGPVALGHRRLSIIDLSVAGSQPMVDSPLGLTVVFNGCIYNYRQLRLSSNPSASGSSPRPTPR